MLIVWLLISSGMKPHQQWFWPVFVNMLKEDISYNCEHQTHVVSNKNSTTYVYYYDTINDNPCQRKRADYCRDKITFVDSDDLKF